MSTVLSYLRSGKSVNVDDDDSSVDKRKSSAEFRGFSVKEKPEQSIPKSKGKSKVNVEHVSESAGDTEAGPSSSGSGDISNDPSIPVDSVPPPSNPPSGPPPPPPPGPSDDESEGSESSDDESDDVAAVESDSSSSSSESMFGAGDSRVMESMVFRGTGFVSWKRKIKVILAAKGLQTAILEVNMLSARKKAKALEILISLNSSGNSSNGNGDRNGNSGFVQAKDRTCYKCHKRGHMARSAGGNYRNDTNPRGSIVCYRCNLTGHIGRNCPQNGDSSRNNGGNGSSSGMSGSVVAVSVIVSRFQISEIRVT
ncbi:formin-binding protein 4-like [Planococcus citri]|uniref:formin-binding protein 4-like n=1 Tax=Planococcus citri TaxID=170843 RepID=UPI0031F92BFC